LRRVLNHKARPCALSRAAVGPWSFHIATLLLRVTSQPLRKGKILNSRTRGDLRSLIWEKRGSPPEKCGTPPPTRAAGTPKPSQRNIALTKAWVRNLQESGETLGSSASTRITRGFIVTISRWRWIRRRWIAINPLNVSGGHDARVYLKSCFSFYVDADLAAFTSSDLRGFGWVAVSSSDAS
jgi:hypothetical protein